LAPADDNGGSTMTGARDDILRGERFAFGDNWRQFLELVNEDRVEAAAQSLRDFLGVDDLAGQSFVDVGSGSGLSSLAARRLGARVMSFDFDPQSVACTTELRRRYFPDDPDWRVLQGSALDADYIKGLGDFDVVYSWGVLHHTGDMWSALALVDHLVAQDGLLWLALYNDQGRASQMWLRLKRAYNDARPAKRRALVAGANAYFEARAAPGRLANRLAGVRSAPVPSRGMDRRRDLVDWVGGYPFEVSRPEQVFDFYRDRGFALRRLKTAGGGLGTNEFLFQRLG
jgi:2-polyprenyl-6-hydroxyphenyl methylase/3-demethylubiquinone-9 3-methyltransferase